MSDPTDPRYTGFERPESLQWEDEPEPPSRWRWLLWAGLVGGVVWWLV